MRFGSLVLLTFSLFAFCAAEPALAAPKKHHKAHGKKIAAREHPAADHYSELVVDAETGHVLYEKSAANLRYPASLTKMMTLYLTFDAIKKGNLDLDQSITVSDKASHQPQTNIALDAGERLPVRTAIESVVVRSANDSAMVLGEKLGGTEFNFALMMTQKARELGMKNTVFRNPSGLPDNKQHTTAFDMARLAIALRRDFPEYYHFFKMTSFDWNGITYPGHNHVMERYAGVDGVKTGFIRASGYNLVTSAERDGHRVVAVIMGGSTISARDNKMISLLDKTFDDFETRKNVASSDKSADGASAMSLDGLEAEAVGNHG
jgi:D-alanyl-D-alanine carboxypeptidase